MRTIESSTKKALFCFTITMAIHLITLNYPQDWWFLDASLQIDLEEQTNKTISFIFHCLPPWHLKSELIIWAVICVLVNVLFWFGLAISPFHTHLLSSLLAWEDGRCDAKLFICKSSWLQYTISEDLLYEAIKRRQIKTRACN